MQTFHRANQSRLMGLTLIALGVLSYTVADDERTSVPTRFVLAGDSTVTDDAGWGKGFAELLNEKAECINLAKSGRSSRSYRTEGWWQKCLDAKPDYLLIQFGHNDHTHLNLDGSRAVAPLVAKALMNAVPEAAGLFSDEAISAAEVPHAYSTSLSHGELQLEETASAATIRQSGKLVLAYNKLSPPVPDGIDPVYQRSGFLHPVASPAGRVVTETFPFDHPHQHGIFTAWVKTTWHDREIDFWNLAGGTGRVLHQRIIGTFAEDGQIGFEADLIHRAEQEPVVDILRERWRITAFATDGSYHGFDLQTTQHALTDKPLVIQKYHYGGVALRGPVRWLTGQDTDSRKQVETSSNAPVREPSEFLNDIGSDRIKGNHEHARWVSLTGQIDGQPVTITVLSHRENFRAPQAARLHPTKPYFVFSPCVDDEFVIDRDHPFTSRYRYLVTEAAPDVVWLNAQWEAWCAEK